MTAGCPGGAEGAAPPAAWPPAPWHLRARAHLSLWRAPAEAARQAGLHTGAGRGHALLALAWIVYGPGGDLTYREIMIAHRAGRPPPGHRGPAVTITRIWVDDAASLAGGRALWGIPKAAAQFTAEPDDAASAPRAMMVREPGATTPFATLAFTPRLALPGRWPFRLATIQGGSQAPTVAAARGRGRLHLGRSSLRFDPAGPLGLLAGRRPVLCLALTDVELLFGV